MLQGATKESHHLNNYKPIPKIRTLARTGGCLSSDEQGNQDREQSREMEHLLK